MGLKPLRLSTLALLIEDPLILDGGAWMRASALARQLGLGIVTCSSTARRHRDADWNIHCRCRSVARPCTW